MARENETVPGPDDGEGGGDDNNRGLPVGVIVGLLILAAVILLVAGVIADAANPDPKSGSCTVGCYVFIRRECPGERTLPGLCFGASWCPGSTTTHPCGTNPTPPP